MFINLVGLGLYFNIKTNINNIITIKLNIIFQNLIKEYVFSIKIQKQPYQNKNNYVSIF